MNSTKTVGLRASGNLPVSYVLTGKLPPINYWLLTGNLSYYLFSCHFEVFGWRYRC